MTATSRPDDARSSDDQAGDDPLGGDQGTEEDLEADNAVEEDMLATLDPDAPPARSRAWPESSDD